MTTDTLEITYKILYALEHKKKNDFMGVILSPDRLQVDPDKWVEVMESLLEEGYIKGIRIWDDITGSQNIDIENAKITLSGAQYLKENSVMVKLGKIATNVISISKNI